MDYQCDDDSYLRDTSVTTSYATDQSGSIEVVVSQEQLRNPSIGDNDANRKKPKSAKPLSAMMRRIKPPRRRNKQRDPLVPINLRKCQSAIVTPKQKGSRGRHLRSSSDFGLYDYTMNLTVDDSVDETVDNTVNNIVDDAVTSSKEDRRESIITSGSRDIQEQHDILLVSSSISEESNIIKKSQSESVLTESLSLFSFYDMVTSSWRNEDDKENPGGEEDVKLVRRGSNLTEDNSSQFFFKEDFDASTWSEVNAANGISILGAAVMTATVVIHPLVFVAGAATAVWAVGALHAAEKGYEFFSDGSFSDLFWDDSTPSSTDNENSIEQKQKIESIEVQSPSNLEKNNIGSQSEDDLITPRNSSPSSMLKFSPPNKKHLTSMDSVIMDYFPSLEHNIVTDVKFPGLNALEFFEVYFADDAPYSFKEFQSTKGDVDIDYGKWKRRSSGCTGQNSFHPNAGQTNNANLVKFPTSSKKERVLNFKTLTKSYFGPAYATARKTQRVTKFSTRLVIIESKTELFDIPFCDRFFVIERWIVEADKHNPLSSIPNKNQSKGLMYTAKLSVSVEVFLLKSCNWERQIRQKTLSTVTELLESWTKKATQALDLTTQKKMQRRNCGRNDDGTSLKSYKSHPTIAKKRPKQEQALKMHKQKLKVIEEKISTGNLEWCNIEMRHSEEAGAQSAFAEVLNPDDWSKSCPKEISIPLVSNKIQKKGVLRRFKTRK